MSSRLTRSPYNVARSPCDKFLTNTFPVLVAVFSKTELTRSPYTY